MSDQRFIDSGEISGVHWIIWAPIAVVLGQAWATWLGMERALATGEWAALSARLAVVRLPALHSYGRYPGGA